MFDLPEDLYTLSLHKGHILMLVLIVCWWHHFKFTERHVYVTGLLSLHVCQHRDVPLNYWCLSHWDLSDKVGNRQYADTLRTVYNTRAKEFLSVPHFHLFPSKAMFCHQLCMLCSFQKVLHWCKLQNHDFLWQLNLRMVFLEYDQELLLYCWISNIFIRFVMLTSRSPLVLTSPWVVLEHEIAFCLRRWEDHFK